ncbi:MAG: type I glyceraldehyde-3-phosphate dehydrogenase [Eubacteriaceae bacterium]|jgi:glyceraldehyde 3-phosphate dehydrogenase|nr:type I glyceraldehyde-3-phosphate dehydrogenase [Eubacteriaceae bacterium]
MAVKLGLNGFGRISRVAIRIAANDPDIEICGINYRNSEYDYMRYMLQYDSTFGQFGSKIETYDKGLVINGKKIPCYLEGEAKNIPWGECGAEYIIDGTGAYTTTEKAKDHIKAGAKKVIISAPAKDAATPTFVMGVNNKEYKKEYKVVSNASCTTNCLAPFAKVVNDAFGIKSGLMSTIHAATAKQKVVDMRSMSDWRRGRCSFNNIIPTSTGAAKAVAKVIPALEGKMTGIAYRVPVADVSLVDLNIMTETPTTYEEICEVVKKASENEMKGILEYVDDEVVSSDFLGDPHTSIFDAREGITLNNQLFKIILYYDNEFGYATKTLELAKYMNAIDNK